VLYVPFDTHTVPDMDEMLLNTTFAHDEFKMRVPHVDIGGRLAHDIDADRSVWFFDSDQHTSKPFVIVELAKHDTSHNWNSVFL